MFLFIRTPLPFAGRTGPNCTLLADPCDTCLNGGTCESARGGTGVGARCRCPAGFAGDRCQRRRQETPEMRPCDPSPCVRGGCQVEGDTAVCLCPPGAWYPLRSHNHSHIPNIWCRECQKRQTFVIFSHLNTQYLFLIPYPVIGMAGMSVSALSRRAWPSHFTNLNK